MKTFEYVAWDNNGSCHQGLHKANSSDEVLSVLREENLTPVSVTEQVVAASRSGPVVRYKRVKSADLSTFCWQLSTMVTGGLPITTAIETIAEEMSNRYFEHVLKTVSAGMQQGESMSDVVKDFPKVFNNLACAMLLAGETGGTLTTCLTRLAEYYENRDKLARKVRGALAYPIFVVCFIVIIIVALMTLIIPRFTVMFDQFKGELPAFTKGFMAVYDGIMHNLPFILLAIAGTVTGLVVFSRTRRGHEWFSRLALEAPVFGRIKMMAFVAIFSKTLATLISSGVSVLDSFGILSGMTGNDILKDGVLRTRERLIEGMSISKSMEASGFFPNVAIKMTQIGEQSGSLSAVLDKTSQYYEKRVDSLVSAMLSMLEPILIVAVGAIVLVVILAMYLPIFSLSV